MILSILALALLPAPSPVPVNNPPGQTVRFIKAPGLQQKVRILRDKWGIAHIYAANQHDLFFAQGYSAAADRLFQMELWKRVGQGRLAEVLGPDYVKRDVGARLLRYRGDMKSEYESYAPDAQEILKAFTDGINAYITDALARRKKGNAVLHDFTLAGFDPEPWKPEDCLSRMAAYGMTGNAASELGNAKRVKELGAEAAQRFISQDPEVKVFIPPGADYSGLDASLLDYLVPSDQRIPFPRESNNWTISGKLTATGKPMLANDPHRSILAPSLRYMVHLVAPGWDVIGAGEPALPGVSIGHNQQIAWGLTIFPVDQQDLYLEELDPQDPERYHTANGWKRMKKEHESVRVKGAETRDAELFFTEHGGALCPVLWRDEKTHRALALRWIGAEPGGAGYLASLTLDRAANWTGFQSAMRRWKLPPENMVYADRSGNIGEISAGLFPFRKNVAGFLPMPGNGEYEWDGFIPFEKLPHEFDPQKGYVATANNRVLPKDYPYKLATGWSDLRIERIHEVLDGAKKKLTMDDMSGLQNDVMSLPARDLQKLLADVPGAEAKLLREWDARLNADSAAAALFKIFQEKLYALIKKHAEVGPEEDSRPIMQQALDFLQKVPERRELLQQALEAAAKDLKNEQGEDPTKWSWGKLHTVTLEHPLGARESAYRLGPFPRPGDGTTVDSTGTAQNSRQQVSGASFREILDLKRWDNSLAVNTPGQSGDPQSKHYSDLLPLWLDGKYFPLVYSKTGVQRNSEEEIRMEP